MKTDKLSLNIGAIYKPGDSNLQNFLNIYSQQLEKRKRSIIFGDFNIDLLSKKPDIKHYLNEIRENGYEIVNKIDARFSTRQTSSSNTLIDHVCSNLRNHTFSMSLIESSLSDHKHIYLEISNAGPKVNNKTKYKALNYKTLHYSITKAEYVNSDNNYNNLEIFLLDQIERNKIDKIKINNAPQSDWINKDIIDSINLKNNLWQIAKTNPKDDTILNSYNEQRNKTKKMIKIAKETYYLTLFQNSSSDPKQMWEIINSLGLNKFKDSTTLPKLKITTDLITDGREVCNVFNEFFSSIGADLANNIPSSYHCNTGNILMYNQNHIHSLTLSEFAPCDCDEVAKIIDHLDSNTSTGLDGICTKTIKSLKNLLVDRLTLCINVCLARGVFPDSLKIAKVSPIYKTGSRSDPGNYRPVSVLPVISKIFERILYNRLNAYLTDKNFLIDQQYGFRPKSSTLTAAVDLVTKIKTHIDQKNFALGIFIDLKKAFDTVSHQKLLQKLNNIGITGTAHDMFTSYLSNRKQVVKIVNFTSSIKNVTYGIPQGSIIGPLMFLIYINNIASIGLTGHLTLYADDTCLFYFDKDISDIINDAQRDLDILNEWLKYNLLTVNTSKTSFMIFCNKNKQIPEFTPLTINNDKLKQSHLEKYLGLWIDDKLTWKPHIEHVKSKLTSLLGALRKVTKCIPRKVRYVIYNSLVKSHLEYLVEIWGTGADTNINPLQRTQNKIIKVLFCYPYLFPTNELYNKTKLFNLKQLYIYKTCILIKNIITKSIQSNISLQIKENKHNLRNKIKLHLAKTRTKSGQKTILSEGAQLFNNLPNSIKECENINIYKNKLRSHIYSLL